MVVASCCF